MFPTLENAIYILSDNICKKKFHKYKYFINYIESRRRIHKISIIKKDLFASTFNVCGDVCINLH